VTELEIGGVVYDQVQLLAWLHQSPKGDATLILVHQLIAALLNVEVGACPGTEGEGCIEDAQALLTQYPVGSYVPKSDRKLLTNVAKCLDEFNNAKLKEDDCCDGGVTQLELVYNGGSDLLNVSIADTDFVSGSTIQVGVPFTINGTRRDGKMSSNTQIRSNSATVGEIHTSCSKPIYPGLVVDGFTVLAGTSRDGGALCPLDPPTTRKCGSDAFNHPPVATDDMVTTYEDTPINIDILANDLDADGDDLQVLFVGDPSSGTLEVNVTGTITYTPNAGFYGGDTFSYVLIDGNGGAAGAVVMVTVEAGMPPPGWAGCTASLNMVGGRSKVDFGDIDDGCGGGVTQLTLRYNGASAAVVEARDGSTVLYSDTVSAGGTFSFVGTRSDGKMGSRTDVFVDGVFNTQIHTSCSKPIYPGLVSGDFEVVSGTSRDGGALSTGTQSGVIEFQGAITTTEGNLATDFRTAYGDGAALGTLKVTVGTTSPVVVYENTGILFDVNDVDAVNNKEKWEYKASKSELISLNWKESQYYDANRDPLLSTDVGKFYTRYIHADETMFRFYFKGADLPLTITVDGIPLVTVDANKDVTYSIDPYYKVKRGKHVDVRYPERLVPGNTIEWFADGVPNNPPQNFVDTQEATDNDAAVATYFNGGGEFWITVPIDPASGVDAYYAERNAQVELSIGEANVTLVGCGEFGVPTYDLDSHDDWDYRDGHGDDDSSSRGDHNSHDH